MGRRIALLMMLAGAALGVGAIVLCEPQLDGGLVAVVRTVPLGIALHVVGAGLFAIGAAKFFARPMAPLYFVLAAIVPVVGMLTVVGLNLVLEGDAGLELDDEEFDIGNPILARPERGGSELVLKPVVRQMRELDSESIGRMILGLSKRGAAERGYQVLRRFQQDSDVELQFYAQNAQRGATEGLEERLKMLRARLDEEPDGPAFNLAIAEVLIELAGRRTTSSSDGNAYVRRAFDHLKKAPEGAQRAALELRGYLLVHEPAAARVAWEKLPLSDPRRVIFEAEVLYAERDWERLAECAGRLESSDTQVRTAREFWRASA